MTANASHVLATGEAFLVSGYRLNSKFSPAADYRVESGTWDPCSGRLPSDEPDYPYRPNGVMPFLPHLFFRNTVLVANYAEDHPDRSAECLGLLRAAVEEMVAASLLAGGARFIRFDFALPRNGYTLSEGWVCSLANGFCLRALARIEATWPGALPYRDLSRELAMAYRVVNCGGRARPWFTWVDPDGYLWFDEYPGDDSAPTLVLNGHVHALLGLYEHARRARCAVSAAMVDGAITTLRFNLHRFRRPGDINRYCLRDPDYSDYLPTRTVRQMGELAELSGDPWFAEMQAAFAADFAEVRLRKAAREAQVAAKAAREEKAARAERMAAKAAREEKAARAERMAAKAAREEKAARAERMTARAAREEERPAAGRRSGWMRPALRRLRAALWLGGALLLLPLAEPAGIMIRCETEPPSPCRV